jgi:hypothetical protein
MSDGDIARLTGVPRTTVRDWRHGKSRIARRAAESSIEGCTDHDFDNLPASAYCYVLGLYLGDGCLSRGRRDVWRVRITMDARYPNIIGECSSAIEALMPGQRVHIVPRKGCVDVSMYSKHWPCLIPQHGPGRKHERPIRLTPWQDELIARDPESFVRGLIHSDGCRVVANDRGTESVRYHFSNRSEDIKTMFCATLDRLGIPWTRPCGRQIAIYRKAAVRRLDMFIGPKT